MRKLYTQYTDSELNTPFMVTFEGNQVQACANDGDTITIGSTEYVRVTDGQGHDVKAVIPNSGDETPHKLLVRLGESTTHDLCYIEDDDVVSSTSIQVTDIVPAPQETVITYTRSDATSSGYSLDTYVEGQVPSNAYLTWEVANMPSSANTWSAVISYAANGGDKTYDLLASSFDPANNAYSLQASESGGEPIVLTSLEYDRTAYNFLENVKRVTYKQLGCDIEIENISTGVIRKVSNQSINYLSSFISNLNSTEGNSAIYHLGSYLQFGIRGLGIIDLTPKIELHIPNT